MQNGGGLGAAVTGVVAHVGSIVGVVGQKAIDVRGGEALQVGAHANAHAFDHVRVQALLEGLFRRGENRLAKVHGFANELVAGGGQHRLAVRQIVQKPFIRRCPEVKVVDLAPVRCAIDHHRAVEQPQCAVDVRPVLMLALVEVAQQVVALAGLQALDLVAQHRPHDLDAGIGAVGRVETGDENALGDAHEPSIADGIAHARQPQVGRKMRLAVGNDADMVKADARQLQLLGDPVRPGFGVTDHDLDVAAAKLALHLFDAMSAEEQIGHGRDVLADGAGN